MGLFDLAKDVMKNNVNQKDLISLLGLSRTFVEAIKKGSFLIPDAVIQPKIEEAISEVDGAQLSSCEFKDTGLNLVVQVKRYLAELETPLRIVISKIQIDNKVQNIQFSFIQDQPIGQNLLGKIVAFLAAEILSNIINGKIAQNDLVVDSKFEKNGSTVVVNLANLKEVQALHKKIPFINHSVLDVLTIDRAEHIERGIIISGKLDI